MSLGAGAYKVGGAVGRRYPWQPCKQSPPGTVTLNCSVEYLPTNTQVILGPELKREGRVGKNTEQKQQASIKAIANTLCKELQARNCVYRSQSALAAPAGGIGPPPSQLGKLLTSICFKVNFAEITLATFKKYQVWFTSQPTSA